jgi:hypothetical protein
MIVWLASYPRSGNTLLRIMLNRFFGVSTFSLYDDDDDIGADQDLAKLVGHRSHRMAGSDFVASARMGADQFFIKTHGKPVDTAKAIYLIRDGRAAIVSHYHYRRAIAKENVSLAQVVKGQVWGGGWSDNIDAWVFTGRPNTLVIRFEDLISDEAGCLEKLADFLQLKIASSGRIDFSQLHAVAPRFFRKGSNTSNVSELEASCPGLFWQLHGQAMLRLGYVSSIPSYPAPADEETHSRSSRFIDRIRPHIHKIIPRRLTRSLKDLLRRSRL